MQKKAEFSAPTVDRAIEKALAQLGLDRDSVSVEVLSIGRKGFLGIGASDAKISVTFEAPDEVQKIRETRPEPVEKPAPKAEKTEKTEKNEPTEKREERRPRDDRRDRRERRPREDDGRSVPRPAAGSPDAPRLVKAAAPSDKPKAKPAPVKAEKADAPRLVRRADGQAVPAPEKKAEKPAPRAERPAPAQPVEEPANVPEPIVLVVPGDPLPEEQYTELMHVVCNFLNGLLKEMNLEGKAVALDSSEEDHIRVELQGPDMGPIIGRRGDTLDAIQYLTSLVLNKKTDGHIRLTIDTENYRVKRAESLERHARKMAAKVVKYRKAMSLEPMNPYERRIVHSALQSFEGVTTHSTGTEPGRRIIISPVGVRQQPERRDGGRRRRPSRRPRENRENRAPETETPATPAETEE